MFIGIHIALIKRAKRTILPSESIMHSGTCFILKYVLRKGNIAKLTSLGMRALGNRINKEKEVNFSIHICLRLQLSYQKLHNLNIFTDFAIVRVVPLLDKNKRK